MATPWHLITCEFPPLLGGVSEHSRILAQAAAERGRDVHVWTAAGSGKLPGVHVHDSLGAFAAADLARTAALLDGFAAPRRLVLQWVPHGYGRRGMNVPFARWIARRARAGDRIDAVVHEPFVDVFGASWAQPAQAAVQRYMTRTIVRAAQRVWLSIPGWEPRLSSMLRHGVVPHVLPVPGTIPVDREPDSIGALRAGLPPGQVTVGYFGTGGAYAERALELAVAGLRRRRSDVVVFCLGRGSEAVATRLGDALSAPAGVIRATGTLGLRGLSHHLQACDVLLQPYVDGVSGRRTTTVSALEHGVPVATTFGALSEPFWRTSSAVELVPAAAPEGLAAAVDRLLEPDRRAIARAAALTLYAARFDPRVSLAPLFDD